MSLKYWFLSKKALKVPRLFRSLLIESHLWGKTQLCEIPPKTGNLTMRKTLSQTYLSSVMPWSHSPHVYSPITVACSFQDNESITISSGLTPRSLQSFSIPEGPMSSGSVSAEKTIQCQQAEQKHIEATYKHSFWRRSDIVLGKTRNFRYS